MAADHAPHYEVVLASGSPRRRDFMHRLGFRFSVVPADIDETPLDGEDPTAYVERLGREKALAVRAAPGSVVIAADTTVAHNGRIVGKPADDADAVAILRALSGDRHEAITGIAVRVGEDVRTRTVSTIVEFADLTDADIAWYVGTGEPLDKAGAYAIQERGAALVRRIEGSSSNVTGLPLAELIELLRELGVEPEDLR